MSRKPSPDDDSILHLHAQSSWHSPAQITGTRQSLKDLRDCLDDALNKCSSKMQSSTSDGETYTVQINLLSTEKMRSDPLPYTDCSYFPERCTSQHKPKEKP